MSARRAFVVVLDACGAGALPDAAEYGDAGADTLVHVAEAVGGLRVPALEALGLGLIRDIQGVAAAATPALHGRLHPSGPGKDSTTGHWELMGVVPPAPLPVYPQGFPRAVLHAAETATGQRWCCNRPYSGTTVIEDFGEHHLQTGELILYTSQDSVMQVAAHVDVLDGPALYEVCERLRRLMAGEHAVGRVIARPFDGGPGTFARTEGRRDFSNPPPSRSYLDALHDAHVPVHAVGKVDDLFAHRGITVKHAAPANAPALAHTRRLLEDLDHGLVFTNLIETDQQYGHRKDVAGFHSALRVIDAEVAHWLTLLRDDDLLILTSDHGVDPAAAHHDHTREHAFLLARFAGDGGRRHDGPMADVGASVHHWLTGGPVAGLPGTPFC
ncbi:MAG: phosphopentomutase [Solirubrobacterales bacterium]|nr:phosphopentomutase [Solirubrobacterales bacterium]